MRRPISSDAEFKRGSGNRRFKFFEDAARDHAKMKGGEPEDFFEQFEQLLKKPRGPAEYKDDDLVASGFRLVRTYDYADKRGGFLYQVLRYEHPQVPNAKRFRQRRKGPDGKWFADAGLVKVPYRWPDILARPSEPIFYTEGEKDADRLASLGFLATTLAGQQWSPEAAKTFQGRDIVIFGDNDDAGREHVITAINALRGFAASTRVVELPDIGRTEDVSDWLDKGHTKEELFKLVTGAQSSAIKATPTTLLDPKSIPPRCWVYKPHYIRQFVSLLISTGGIGKSSLAISEALAMVSGKPLFGIPPLAFPNETLRVWYWNGEDPLEELYRRFAAAMKHYKLAKDEIGADRLFINSGRNTPIVIAEEDKRIVRLNKNVVDELTATIRENKIDVAIVDPFVTTHRVNENDNGAIDRVVKAWNAIAEETNTAVMLVHHSRKPSGGELTVDDTRGASALLAAARSARTINTMTTKEAEECEIEERQRRNYFSSYVGKANLSMPAENRDWFKIEAVDLENGFDLSDSVGVVTPWHYPRVEVPKITDIVIRQACDKIKAGGPWRKSTRDQRALGRPADRRGPPP